ncbi:MAG: NAD(P)/FAD-dependent oxidoreductase [Bacteroidota bacterium]
MNRKEFLKNSITLGAGLPFLSFLMSACDEDLLIEIPKIEGNFSGKVIIVGAGAAGLTAGYILRRNNIDFEIIEAAPIYGGRVRRVTDFIDLPLDTGAVWMHQHPSMLTYILNDPSVNAEIDFVNYVPKSIQLYRDGKLRDYNWIGDTQAEHKFKSTTWFGFFEQYIVPGMEDKIHLNQPVTQIDYSGEGVQVETQDGTVYTGDKVLITIPVTMMKNNFIEFTPALPTQKTENFNRIQMDGGLKVAIEFKERFYPDLLIFRDLLTNLFTDDGRGYFNAVFGKETDRHVIGLFAINEDAAAFTDLGSDQAIFEAVMAELDEIFDGKASEHYVNHIVQNWTAEPFVQGSYSYEFDGDQESIVEAISEPLNNKVYFAGEAFSIDHQATVHGACESAYAIMPEILR